jgi:hypothetical protein
MRSNRMGNVKALTFMRDEITIMTLRRFYHTVDGSDLSQKKKEEAEILSRTR